MATTFDPITGFPTTKKAQDTTIKPNTAGGGSPSSVGGGTLGSDPNTSIDYKALIARNPFFVQAKALYGDPSGGQVGSMGVSDMNDLSNAWKSALVNYGNIPDLAAAARNSGIDLNNTYLNQFATPDIYDKANQNQFSFTNDLAYARGQVVDDTRRQLAARGLLDSGESPYLLGEGGQAAASDQGTIGRQFAEQANTGVQSLLQTLLGSQNQFTNAENQRLAAYAKALYDAMQQEIQRMQSSGAGALPDSGGGGDSGGPPQPQTALNDYAAWLGHPAVGGPTLGNPKLLPKPKPSPYLYPVGGRF